jgi:Tol biopolymer transport system component
LLDVSPDGKAVAFARVDSSRGIWSVPSNGGEVTTLASSGVAAQGVFTADGQRIIAAELAQSEDGFVQTIVHEFPATGGGSLVEFRPIASAVNLQEGPNGTLSFMDRNEPARNVFTTTPDGDVVQVTRFSEGRLTGHSWSPNMKRLAVIANDGRGENVWVADTSGGNLKRVTSFDDEEVFSIQWVPDSQQIVVRAGRRTRDMVMITNFR